MPTDGPSIKGTILVVDDEPAVRRVLLMRLQLAGYNVVSAEDGEEALEKFHSESPDLVVLDVMLPKMDGFAVCRRLRAESCVPIIFLSALESISERVAGLDLGADDYLPKPFSPKELEARISTILRRVGSGAATVEPREIPSGQGVMRVGDLVVDTNRRQVNRGTERIALTYTEFSLLELLFRDPGHVVPRAEILEQLWG
ncbi:MAG: response regulator, partial [Synechococcus sp.]